LSLTPSSARAQFSYGYDSFVGYPQSQAFWYSSGYSPVYNDPTTGVFADGSVAGFRGVAPYYEPPFGQFGPVNGLNANGRPSGVTVTPCAAAANQHWSLP